MKASIQLQKLTRLSEGLAQNHTDLANRVTASQAELSGRVQQSETGLSQRFDQLTRRIGDGLNQQTQRTGENLNRLAERLAVIDRAQQTITDLSQQMVSLQDILSNKQSRGAFGEIQLRDLVTAALPPSIFEFQVTLSNSRRADCLLKLPNPPGSIAIDSKFPLESFQLLRDAEEENSSKYAAKAFETDIRKHVRDIAERYIVPGETADSALMFLPSEAVYAELHANFRGVVEESYRNRVWIVSPTTLMATLNTVRAVIKDARMREQAGVIQSEVVKMLDDVGRLDKRVSSLQTHFNLALRDMRDIRISTNKIVKKGEKIEELHFAEDNSAADLSPEPSATPPKLQSAK
ncbi:MAG: DNA recombination protein RmuC [Magnetovibrio sp.]|nr:DNA recombination protein RmuC [Magnetovibrio sp.]